MRAMCGSPIYAASARVVYCGSEDGGVGHQGRHGSSFWIVGRVKRIDLELPGYGMRSRFGRVDNGHVGGGDSPQQRLQQRVMGASENQHIGVARIFGKSF